MASTLKVGARVQSTHGFHIGCRGVVTRVKNEGELSFDVEVLRDGSDSSIGFDLHELRLINTAPERKKKQVYVIGSLRNSAIPSIAERIRNEGYLAFDDWHAAGPEADDFWKGYEQARGRTYRQALEGSMACNAFSFDKRNIDASDAGVLVMPAGKSAHLELGYMTGQGKPTFIVLEDESDRWDLMYKFATKVIYLNELEDALRESIGS